MGYYTNYKLEISIKEPTRMSLEKTLSGYSKEELIDVIINKREVGPGDLDAGALMKTLYDESENIQYALGKDGHSGDSCKWYGHHDEMLAISKKYPDALFTLHGEGEETGDIWTKYYRAGKSQEAKATIIVDEFDESKLS